MSLKALSVSLTFFAATTYAAITPSMSVNQDAVCEIYHKSYVEQLENGYEPSFKTIEVASHPDNTVYTPSPEKIIPIEFSEPFSNSQVTWMKWTPIKGMAHSFKWGGTTTNATAIGLIKPSSDTSFVMQTNTIGWRGPFYRVWIIKDSELTSLIEKADKSNGIVPIEGSGATLLYPDFERGFVHGLPNLFKFEEDFFTVTDDNVFKVTSGVPKSVCQIGIASNFNSPQIKALEDAANKTLMTEGVTHIPMYYGTMGNSHIHVEDGFKAAIEKPWLIRTMKNGQCYVGKHINHCETNKRVEGVLEEFAKSDPWSFREIQAIRHHMEGALLVLTEYYTEQLNIEHDIATGMAAQAIYNFLEKTVILHPFIQYGVNEVIKASDPYTLDNPEGAINTNWFNKTELMWAAHFNDYDAVNRLLSTGANLSLVTSTDDDYSSVQFLNRSALTYAAENATVPLIQLLISSGADIGIKDSKGNSIESYFKKNPTLDMTWAELTSSPAVPVKASFDCKLAKSKYEKSICGSDGLSLYDQQLGALYKKVRDTKLYPEIKTLQRGWLKSLRIECSANGVELTNCMKEKYRSRIKYFVNLL